MFDFIFYLKSHFDIDEIANYLQEFFKVTHVDILPKTDTNSSIFVKEEDLDESEFNGFLLFIDESKVSSEIKRITEIHIGIALAKKFNTEVVTDLPKEYAHNKQNPYLWCLISNDNIYYIEQETEDGPFKLDYSSKKLIDLDKIYQKTA